MTVRGLFAVLGYSAMAVAMLLVSAPAEGQAQCSIKCTCQTNCAALCYVGGDLINCGFWGTCQGSCYCGGPCLTSSAATQPDLSSVLAQENRTAAPAFRPCQPEVRDKVSVESSIFASR